MPLPKFVASIVAALARATAQIAMAGPAATETIAPVTAVANPLVEAIREAAKGVDGWVMQS